MPFTQLQANGLANITSIVHCIEVLPYLGLLYVLTLQYGILGMAWAWLLRIIIDTMIFFVFSKRLLGKSNE